MLCRLCGHEIKKNDEYCGDCLEIEANLVAELRVQVAKLTEQLHTANEHLARLMGAMD